MPGKRIWKKFEDYMAAAAYAEAGETDTARSLLRRRRSVLLVLTPRAIDARSAEYARNVCLRIDGDMEILLLPGNDAQRRFLSGYLEKLREDGIESRVVTTTGCIKQRILEHTSRRRDIQFVVIESPEELDISCDEEAGVKESGFLARLRCPLVVVSEAGSGA